MTETATIANDRFTAIGTLVNATAARAAVTLEAAAVRHLVDYLCELEVIAREYADRQRDGTAGLRAPVLGFAWLMEHKLRRHDGDRGPRAWLNDDPAQLLNGARGELIELEDALDELRKTPAGERPAANLTHALALEAADVGNLAMMVADRMGGLEGAGPGQAPKRGKRLRHMHRMLERLQRLIDRLEVDGVTPRARIAWLHSDEKAMQWTLQQLDPHGEYRPPARLEGDGSGQTLPPIDSNAGEREAPGVTFVDSDGAVHPLSAIAGATIRPTQGEYHPQAGAHCKCAYCVRMFTIAEGCAA